MPAIAATTNRMCVFTTRPSPKRRIVMRRLSEEARTGRNVSCALIRRHGNLHQRLMLDQLWLHEFLLRRWRMFWQGISSIGRTPIRNHAEVLSSCVELSRVLTRPRTRPIHCELECSSPGKQPPPLHRRKESYAQIRFRAIEKRPAKRRCHPEPRLGLTAPPAVVYSRSESKAAAGIRTAPCWPVASRVVRS